MIKFILENADNSCYSKDIIMINQNMLNKLKIQNNFQKNNIIGGNENNTDYEYRNKINSFKKSTESIIESLHDPIKQQNDLLIKTKNK
jgi:hypothetical protein